MIQADAQVVDANGLQGIVERAAVYEGDGSVRVVVLFAGGQRIRLSADMLTQGKDGIYRIPLSLSELQAMGGSAEERTIVIPVMKEALSIERRIIDVARVRVTKTVREAPAVVDETLWREEMDVERVEINRLVDGPVQVRNEGDTTIVSLLEEVLVIEKRLLLREEVRLTPRRVKVHDKKSVKLRAEEVAVERVALPRDGQENKQDSGQSPEKVSGT